MSDDAYCRRYGLPANSTREQVLKHAREQLRRSKVKTYPSVDHLPPEPAAVPIAKAPPQAQTNPPPEQDAWLLRLLNSDHPQERKLGERVMKSRAIKLPPDNLDDEDETDNE